MDDRLGIGRRTEYDDVWISMDHDDRLGLVRRPELEFDDGWPGFRWLIDRRLGLRLGR